jgi:hypothetical protein
MLREGVPALRATLPMWAVLEHICISGPLPHVKAMFIRPALFCHFPIYSRRARKFTGMAKNFLDILWLISCASMPSCTDNLRLSTVGSFMRNPELQLEPELLCLF